MASKRGITRPQRPTRSDSLLQPPRNDPRRRATTKHNMDIADVPLLVWAVGPSYSGNRSLIYKKGATEFLRRASRTVALRCAYRNRDQFAGTRVPWYGS